MGRLRNTLNLIHYDAILIDRRAQQQVCGFLFDQKVAVRCGLVEAQRCANPEDSLPGIGACYVHVEFIRELHSVLILVVLRVVKKVAVRLFAQLREGCDVLEAALTVREEEQVYRNLPVSQI